LLVLVGDREEQDRSLRRVVEASAALRTGAGADA